MSEALYLRYFFLHCIICGGYWCTSTADRYGRLYGQIWQISADYKYKQTLWLDLTDFGRFSGLQVQQQTLWFAAVDLVDYKLDV